jgi:hypothetical protein
VCCNERGVASFDKLRHLTAMTCASQSRPGGLPRCLRSPGAGESRLRCASRRWQAFCAGLCRGCCSTPISRIPATSCSSMPARWGLRASSLNAWVRLTVLGVHPTGSSSRTRRLGEAGGGRGLGQMILTRPLAEEFFERRCVGEFSSLHVLLLARFQFARPSAGILRNDACTLVR